jgi:hypothetical protein
LKASFNLSGHEPIRDATDLLVTPPEEPNIALPCSCEHNADGMYDFDGAA